LLERGRALKVSLHAGGHVGDNQSAKVLLVLEGVVDGEHPSPGMAEENKAVKTEAAANLFDLFGVTRNIPERGIIRDVGVTDAKLS